MTERLPRVVTAYVALGSNMGDRHAMLQFARDQIGALPDTSIVASSDIEETAPIGAADQPPYLNQMVAVVTALAPRQLLDSLLEIEQRAGRVRAERWGPRTLDCDIVTYSGPAIAEPGLTLPHPELPNRDFWQRELAQVQAALGPPPQRQVSGG